MMKIEFSPLAIFAALVVFIAACLIMVRSCGDGGRAIDRPYIETPADTSFTAVKHEPVLSSQLMKKGAKLPSNVKASDVDKVVQIKLKTGETLDLVVTKTGGQNPETGIYVAKDSSIESVTVLDVKPPAFGISLLPGAGATLTISGKFSPSLCFSLFHIDKYRLPVLAADLSGAGIGAGMEILPNVEVTAGYWYEFRGTREFKAGVYYEF